MLKKLLNQLLGNNSQEKGFTTFLDKIPAEVLVAILQTHILESCPEETFILPLNPISGNYGKYKVYNWKSQYQGFAIKKDEPIVSIEADAVGFELQAPFDGYVYPLLSEGAKVKGGIGLALFSTQKINIEELAENLRRKYLSDYGAANKYLKPELLQDQLSFGLDMPTCIQYLLQYPKEYYFVAIPENITKGDKIRLFGWVCKEGTHVKHDEEICTILVDEGEIYFPAHETGYVYPIAPINCQLEAGARIAIISRKKIDFDALHNEILKFK